jgi:predicted MFS family arabinose efflux permease
LTGIDVLKRAGVNAHFVGSVNVTAINRGIMVGTPAGGTLIDHIELGYIGYIAAAFVICAWGVRRILVLEANPAEQIMSN